MKKKNKCAQTCEVCGAVLFDARRATCSSECLSKLIQRRVSAMIWNAEIIRNIKLKPASQPTLARPGSKEKIAVFQRRFECGEELFHPLDSVMNG